MEKGGKREWKKGRYDRSASQGEQEERRLVRQKRKKWKEETKVKGERRRR